MPFKDFTIEEAKSADINTYLMNQMIIVCTSSTRPSTPVEGMHIWETDTKALLVRVGSSWKVLNALPIWAVKSASESVANSTTPQDDDELFVTVQPNSTYLFQCSLEVSGSPDADMRISWSAPSGATFHWSAQSPWIAQTDVTHSTISITSMTSATAAADIAVYSTSGLAHAQVIIVGMCMTGSSGGTVRLRWAQTSANATPTVVNPTSNLLFQRVA